MNKASYRLIAAVFVAVSACVPAASAAGYTLSYAGIATEADATTNGPGGVPTVHSSMPVYPLRHPFKAFAELNRGGTKVFAQKWAVPYVALGMVALANDKKTEKWFDVAAQGEPTPKFSKTFNNFGDGKVLLPAMGVLYLAGKSSERDTAKLWAVSVLNATVFSQSIKMLTGKARPSDSPDAIQYHGPSTKYDSFPSGHMTAATASAVVLGHQYPKAKYAFYALAACVGVARIDGRNHWPSDVYWGAGVGYYGAWQVLHNKDDVLRWRF